MNELRKQFYDDAENIFKSSAKHYRTVKYLENIFINKSI